MTTDGMTQRPLGRTGLAVSAIGLGCWQLASQAWGTQEGHEAARIVHTALDQGCTFFDTAPGYGEGRSETLLGQALRGHRQRVVICSKFGHPASGPADFRTEALRPSVEASMRLLQTDYLDVLLVHNPGPEHLDGRRTDLYAALADLQAAGWVRSYGVSVDRAAEMELALASTGSGVMEVLFNALHQDARQAFDRAAAQGVGLIAKVPLDSGWLAGRYTRHTRFEGVRTRWTPADTARRAAWVDRVRALLPPGLPLARGALAFVLAHPAVATAIPGARTPQQLLDNLAAAQVALPTDTVQALHAMWDAELAADPLPW